MDYQSIAKRRLVAQHIVQADFTDPVQVVQHMVAMQAQDYNGALLSIALRTKQGTLQSVEQAIADRKIVRTWPMRGTLHILAAEDVRWVTSLLAPRALATAASRRRQLEIDDAVITSAKEQIVNALTGHKRLTRAELCTILDNAGIATAGQRGIHLLHHLSEQGVLCFGPHAGKQPTFVLLDEWLAPTPEKTREEALEELARRYFLGHGPATLKDFAGWAGLTLTDARYGLEIAKPQLLSTIVNDTEYWSSPALSENNIGTYLLPGFDEFILGYKDRSAMLSPAFANNIVPGGNGMFLPTLVINGQVVGTWKRIMRSKGQEIIIKPFQPLTKRQTASIQPPVEHLTQCYSLPTTWRINA